MGTRSASSGAMTAMVSLSGWRCRLSVASVLKMPPGGGGSVEVGEGVADPLPADLSQDHSTCADTGREPDGEGVRVGEGEQVLDRAGQRTGQQEAEARGGHLATGLDGAQRLPTHPDPLREGLLRESGVLSVSLELAGEV